MLHSQFSTGSAVSSNSPIAALPSRGDVAYGQYVGDGWRTSRTKVLDNALIAYCQNRLSLA